MFGTFLYHEKKKDPTLKEDESKEGAQEEAKSGLVESVEVKDQ